MKLFILEYIENLLRKAHYEYDPYTYSWCAYVKELPGAYAQADSVEQVRGQLMEVIEDYILVSLQEGRQLPGFKALSGIILKHEYMERGDEKIFIPNPHGKDIGVPLIKAMIQQLEISRDEFIKL